MVMYHGTPYGGFTEFRNGSYFTEHKSLAEVFHSPSASSIRGRYDKATSPLTYSVYLNIEKPFDTRRAKERRIFNNEYYMHYGTGTALMDSGLPDWLDGMDLMEFLEEKGYGYDGLILDEGGTGGYGEEVRSRGLSYVVFSPEQVKNTTNTNPTSSPDIRFSLKDTSDIAIDEALERHPQAEKAAEIIRAQHKTIAGRYMGKDIAARMAKKLARNLNSSYSADILADNLSSLFNTYAQNPEIPAKEFIEAGASAVKPMLEKSRSFDQNAYEIDSNIRDYIKNTKIQLSDTQRQEAAYAFDSYRAYRTSLFGKANIGNDGIALDVAWMELSSMRPDIFPPDTNEGDQVTALYSVANGLGKENYYINEYGYDLDGAAIDAFLQIYADYSGNADVLRNVREMESYSKEQYEERLKRIRAENTAERQELARKYNQAKKERRAEDMAAFRREYRALADRGNEKLMKQRAYYDDRAARERAKRAETAMSQKLRASIEKTSGELKKWLSTPTKEKHVPEFMRDTILDVLDRISFESKYPRSGSTETNKSRTWRDAMDVLSKELKNYAMVNAGVPGLVNGAEKYQEFVMTTTLEFIARLERFADTLIARGVTKVSELDTEQLREFDQTLRIIKHIVTNTNKFLSNRRFAQVNMAAEETIANANERKERRTYKGLGWADRFLNMDMLDSYSYFEMFGEGGKSIGEALDAGMNQTFTKIRETEDFMQAEYEKRKFKPNDILAWGKKTHTFELANGKSVTYSTLQIMELYNESYRPQALKHILGGGIEVSDIDSGGLKRVIRQKNSVQHTMEDIMNITGVLSEQQRQIADDLRGFLSTTAAEWGNEASLKEPLI